MPTFADVKLNGLAGIHLFHHMHVRLWYRPGSQHCLGSVGCSQFSEKSIQLHLVSWIITNYYLESNQTSMHVICKIKATGRHDLLSKDKSRERWSFVCDYRPANLPYTTQSHFVYLGGLCLPDVVNMLQHIYSGHGFWIVEEKLSFFLIDISQNAGYKHPVLDAQKNLLYWQRHQDLQICVRAKKHVQQKRMEIHKITCALLFEENTALTSEACCNPACNAFSS